MKKKLLFCIRSLFGTICLLLTISLAAHAQQRMEIKGVVVDANNDPIIGASVVVKNTTMGVGTQMNGTFTLSGINKAGSVILEISFLGYKTMEAVAYPDRENRFVLEEDTTLLDEVVVTGYGNFKKSTYTGSATVVSMDKLKDIPVASATQMLESHVPGLSITSGSGQTGASQTLRIRGQGSVNASSAPLIVLDGVPILSSSFSNDSNTSSIGLDRISTINPNDIENITVLKDATSTSLYGARGSNGVILITTKKGSEGKTNITFRSSYAVSDFAVRYRPTMGGQERRELIHEGFVNYYVEDKGMTMEKAMAAADEQTEIYAGIPEGGFSDWRGALFHKGRTQQYDLSLTSGSKTTQFSANLGYLTDKGISLSAGFKRYSGRMNLNHIHKKFDFNLNMMFTYTDSRPTPEGGKWAGAITPAVENLTPSDPIYNPDGSYSQDFSNNDGYNPLHEDANTIAYNKIGSFLGAAAVGYQIIDGLKISASLNIDYNNNRQFRFWNPEARDGSTNNGVGALYTPQRFRHQENLHLSYQKDFGKHHVNTRVGTEIMNYKYDFNYSQKKNYGYWGNPALSNATEPMEVSQYIDRDRQASFFGLLNYDYDDRFYLSASYRRDGSSRLGPDSRWGNFWSVSGSWRMSKEKFMEPLSGWLSDLKVKASYGVNGNLPDEWYAWHSIYAASEQYGQYPALYERDMGNLNLSWENGYNLNVGLDVTLFNRVGIEINVYKRDTKDLLIKRPVFLATGFSQTWDNFGHMRNTGFEFEVSSVNMQKKDFRWTSALNLYHNKSKIIKLGPDGTPIYNGRRIRQEGEAWSTAYVYEYLGVDPQTGEAQYRRNKNLYDKDENLIGRPEDVITDLSENKGAKIIWKDTEPVLRGGFNNTFNYKFIDLSLQLSFTLGGWTIDDRQWNLGDDGKSPSTNKSIELRRRWKKPGDVTDVPKYKAYYQGGGWYTSTRSVHSTDHLRVKNLTIGLRAPKKWTDAVGISSARVYFSGQNLWTWTPLKLYDPELWGEQGVSVPPLKTFSFGLDISF